MKSTPEIHPFRIAVPDDAIHDLRRRIRSARYPAPLDDPDWAYGIEHGVLHDLARYWADEYDWRKHEARLNAWPHFKTKLGEFDIHFLHVRSKHEDALPLIISHGWPGSVVEFMEIIDPLVDPEAHGGSAADAFHVVCPSLPGYGWSQPNDRKGMHPASTARLWAELMARLGYERYGAQGGDWGSMITQELARQDPDHCVGIHLNFLFHPPGPEELAELEGLSASERARWDRFGAYMALESGYAQIQGTKPQTIGALLADSPVGQLAWIVEKFRSWTDCDGRLENAVDREALLTNVSVYWFTNTGASSGRFYYETRADTGSVTVSQRLETPVGHACFPKEIFGTPRKWLERHFNIVHWTDMPHGGHFAAMEQPGLLVEDVRSFFRIVRQA